MIIPDLLFDFELENYFRHIKFIINKIGVNVALKHQLGQEK